MFISSSCLGIDSENTIAVIVNNFGSSFSAGVDPFVHFVAVGCPPVIASESRNIRESIIV